jgi:hypothetical protein
MYQIQAVSVGAEAGEQLQTPGREPQHYRQHADAAAKTGQNEAGTGQHL